jgi:hypothetical protein
MPNFNPPGSLAGRMFNVNVAGKLDQQRREREQREKTERERREREQREKAERERKRTK